MQGATIICTRIACILGLNSRGDIHPTDLFLNHALQSLDNGGKASVAGPSLSLSMSALGH